MKYTEEQIKFVKNQREWNTKWKELTKEFNETFQTSVTLNALRKLHKRTELLEEMDTEEVDISLLRNARSAKKTSHKNTKAMNVVMDAWEAQENLLDEIENTLEDLFERLPEYKLPVVASEPSGSGKHMTMELLISDLHIGKLTKSFNYEVARDRLSQVAHAVMFEFKMHSKLYTIDELVMPIMGDVIESATMHGAESLVGCEGSNSEQIVKAVELLFENLICPLASLGVKIHIPCVTGNHDRLTKDKTYNQRGREHVTYVIYSMLAKICSIMKLDKITFDIPDRIFTTYKIYDENILYVHGDEFGNTKEAIEREIARRQTQIGELITGIRFGHWHEVTTNGRGRFVSNGSLCGQDDYAETKGFNTQAMQVLNFYCDSDKRPGSYYKSFPIYLR